MRFFVYLLECSDKSFYCGCTRNLEKRLAAHNEGRGAKYTRARRPLRLAYSERKGTLKAAMRRELEIKTFTRKQKEGLVAMGRKAVFRGNYKR